MRMEVTAAYSSSYHGGLTDFFPAAPHNVCFAAEMTTFIYIELLGTLQTCEGSSWCFLFYLLIL